MRPQIGIDPLAGAWYNPPSHLPDVPPPFAASCRLEYPRVILTISLPDEFEAKLIAHGAASPNKAAQKLIERFVEYKPTDRALFFPQEERGALEKIYGEPIDRTNLGKFVEWVRQRACANVGGIEVPLSAAQLKRAQTNATKLYSHDGQQVDGAAVKKYMERMVQDAVTVSLGA